MNKIYYIPHPILRQKSKLIEKITSKEIDISKTMTDIMIENSGVGLAANQIGVLKQIITINHFDPNKKIEKIYTYFNPKIIFYSKKKIIMEEGCLSLPKQFAEIERSEEIIVQYTNENNDIIEERKNGFLSRVLQHEIDHLKGILFIDYLSSLKRNMIIKRVNKLKKIGEI